MKKTILVIAIIAVLVGGYFLVGKTRETNGETIKIGAVLPMTGIGANYGENQSKAITLAVNEINETGGVLGKKIEVVFEDDATDPAKTVSAFTKVITIDKVPVVIGGVWDFLANAAMPLIESKKITTISASVAPDTLEKPSDMFFSVFPPISIHQPVVEKYLRQESGNKVAIMYVNNAWGKAHAEMYKKAITATGKELVADVELPKFDNNDIQREITLLKTKQPDILLTAVTLADPKFIIEKNQELGLNAKIFGHDNILFASSNPGINTGALKGVVVYRVVSQNSQFIEKFKKAYGKEPISEADKAYDAVYLIAEAIKNSKDFSSSGIAAGLKKINGYTGVSGPINYTESNWPTKDTARLEIFNGENFVPYLEN